MVTCVFCRFYLFVYDSVVVRRRVFCCASELFVSVGLSLRLWRRGTCWIRLSCCESAWVFYCLVQLLGSKVCVCCLSGPSCLRCFFRSCCLCSCIILFILLFSSASCGSVGFCFRAVFLVYGCAYVFWKEFVCWVFCHEVRCACRQQV